MANPQYIAISFNLFITAGGLATYLHADTVRSKIPSNIPVNAISDAGYVHLRAYALRFSNMHDIYSYVGEIIAALIDKTESMYLLCVNL